MKLLLSIFLLLFVFPLFAQYTEVEIGKRYHPVFDREIKPENVGHKRTAYRKLFFKLSEDGEYRKTGTFGGKLKPFLDLSIPEVKESFSRYQSKKKWSYVLAGGAFASLEAWVIASIIEMGETSRISHKAYFSKRSLPWLVSYFATAYPSMYINYRADNDLLEAVRLHNVVHSDK